MTKKSKHRICVDISNPVAGDLLLVNELARIVNDEWPDDVRRALASELYRYARHCKDRPQLEHCSGMFYRSALKLRGRPRVR